MSRSYKSVSIPTGKSKSGKLFKRTVNKGIRHNAKIAIQTCTDYDQLIIPVQNDILTMYDSPTDGRGPWFFRRYGWWTEERTLRYYQDYLKGFRK